MCTSTQLDHDLFRILLYRRNGKELLLEQDDRSFALPALLIPRHTRVAQQIAEAIRREWKFQTVCLFPVGDRHFPAFAVELWDEAPTHSINRSWIPVHTLAENDFHEPRHFYAIKLAVKLFEQYSESKAAGPFGRMGWLRDVTDWVEANAAPLGFRLSGQFQQFNASPTFSLVRFETDGLALWFKAVGEPNRHEFPITIELASAFPVFVPQIIATREDWNGWLSIEAEGTHPDEKSGRETWKGVATALGELQVASFGQTLHLLNAGCRDVRASSLLQLVAPFLEAMAELMDRQTKDSPPPLSRTELLTLKTQLKDALSEAAESEMPDVLGHLDFNAGNIVVCSAGHAFLDWAEACAGTPLITFQYLLEHLRRYGQHSWESAITSAYLNAWRRFIPPRKIAAAVRISPLLAVFAYAACADAWREPEKIKHLEIARYFRGLTRRMKREGDRLVTDAAAKGVSCLI